MIPGLRPGYPEPRLRRFPPTHRPAVTPLRRPADPPLRRYAVTPTRRYADPPLHLASTGRRADTPSRRFAHPPNVHPFFHRATCLGRPTALKEARTIRVDLSQAGQWAFLEIIVWPAQRWDLRTPIQTANYRIAGCQFITLYFNPPATPFLHYVRHKTATIPQLHS
jgi:hypothetical protein